MANTIISPAVYSKKWLKNYDQSQVMADLVSTTYQGDMMENGDTLYAQKFSNVTISTYTPGSDISVQSLTMTNQSISINQKKAALGVIDATEIRQSHLPLVNGFMKRFAMGFGATIDDRLLGHYADVDSGNILGSDAAPIAITKDNVYDYFVEARKMLKVDGVPFQGLVAVVDEDTESAILRSPDFVKATQTGDQVVRKGEIGSLAGFRVVTSPRIATVSGVRHQMFFQPEFIELVVQLDYENLLQTYKPEKQFGTGIKGLALYGSAVLQTTAGVVLKKAA